MVNFKEIFEIKKLDNINGNIVLHANTIANLHIVAHVHILSERTAFADDGTRLDMAKMPNLRPSTDAHIVIDITTLVYKIGFLHDLHYLILHPTRGKHFRDVYHLNRQSGLLNIGFLMHQAGHVCRNNVFGSCVHRVLDLVRSHSH